jgi:hypothetical protein
MHPTSLLRRYAACWAAVLGIVVAAESARSEEFYYVAVFGSQQMPPNPNYTHSFAAFTKATGEGPCPKAFVVDECFSISWLPRTLEVRTRKLCPECGVNYPLHPTIKLALSEDQRVSLWGPYRIDRELYEKARAQAGLLESGRVQYKAAIASACLVPDGARRRVGSLRRATGRGLSTRARRTNGCSPTWAWSSTPLFAADLIETREPAFIGAC